MKPSNMFQRLWNINVATVLIFIALAGPALWSVWLRTPRQAEHRSASVHTPRIRYILVNQDNDHNGLWSPLLFSIPTPYGFSRTVQMSALETRGIPAVPTPDPPLLTMSGSALQANAGSRDALPEARIRGELSTYNPSPPPAGPPSPGLSDEPLWQADAGLKQRNFTLPADWASQLPELPAPWSVRAAIEIDRDGHVRHVFLSERHEQDELNAAVVALLRQGRAAADDRAGYGMVTVARP